ncbi:uncharacterized protein LOC127716663 [Mytilus californianus]|uniref:uncharacterized protein LOC127716663 n=1 Tax=Mytilus californianus TaxID=6549 RepID=UPI002248558A|nr:uncharacterized protein LOC127716663 [Mytilus californianus]
MYAIIDDQSNRSLAAPEFFSLFNVQEETKDYMLSTCSGSKVTSGKRGNGFVVKSVQDNTRFNLPELIECDNIPNNRNEIATTKDILQYQHLQELQKNILPIDGKCKILLLIGRDLIEAHHVLDQRLGPPKAPFAQKLNLGWIIVGEIRSDKQHVHLELTTKKTNPTCSVVKPHTKKLPECNKTNTQSNGIRTDSFKQYPRLHGQPKTKSATSIVKFAEDEKFISEATSPKVNADKEKYIRKHSIPKESFNLPLDTQGQEESRIDNSDLSHREKEHGTGWSTVCRKRKGKRPFCKTFPLDRISVSKGDSSIRTTAMKLDLRSPRSRRKHHLI